VTTLERVVMLEDTALFRRIWTQYQRVVVLPGTVGDGAMRIYVGPDGS